MSTDKSGSIRRSERAATKGRVGATKGGEQRDKQTAWPDTRQDSAQGLLLIILGDLVWRKHESVWTSSLLTALDNLGVSENAARKAIFRANQTGIIQLHKQGRRARCSIGEVGRQVFQEGIVQVYGFRGESPDWDGRWLVILATVPETHRNIRHYLKTRFRWVGMGSPTPGVWIAPRMNKAAIEVLRELDLEKEIYSYVGRFGPVGQEAAMVQSAWDIAGLEQLYRDFIERFTPSTPNTPRDKFCAYINLIHAWRKFPYIDPQLPEQFLPSPWIGQEAARLLHEKRDLWSASASQYWGELQSI